MSNDMHEWVINFHNYKSDQWEHNEKAFCFISHLASPVHTQYTLPGDPFHGLNLIPTWISSYIQYKVWKETTYTFTNFNGATYTVWEQISDSTLYLTRYVVIYPCGIAEPSFLNFPPATFLILWRSNASLPNDI